MTVTPYILLMLMTMTDNVMGMCCAYAGVFKSEILLSADFRGLTVCRKQGGLVTDYVYDDFGELRWHGRGSTTTISSSATTASGRSSAGTRIHFQVNGHS